MYYVRKMFPRNVCAMGQIFMGNFQTVKKMVRVFLREGRGCRNKSCTFSIPLLLMKVKNALLMIKII